MAVYLVSALLLGLMSSLHCLGMCGPLVIGILPPNASSFEKLTYLGLYHGGRLLTYGILGAFAGLIAEQINLPNIQQTLSIVLGSLLLLWVVFHYFGWLKPLQLKGVNRIFQKSFTKFWAIQGKVRFLLMGGLNGLLPCGMVYIAMTASATSASIPSSMAFMAVFGLGTLPLLAVVSGIGTIVKSKYKYYLRSAQPMFLFLFAAILIVRGLNLGIPYLSPKVSHASEKAEMECCVKK